MEYRDFEIKVVQGFDRKRKWSVRLQEARRHGEARARDGARHRCADGN
ncbi:hypothetical protein [Bradyrhizobium sp. sBnM-33]|nr:hypothetical protein [Bradyrhizobium sp. sBnM-33]WOH52380.1 hypothetical protein RX328_09370 [Bradyrhizobium sp. sBnM-33]